MTFKAALFCTVLSVGAVVSASGPKVADGFKNVTDVKPACFGREYSRAELKAHPNQSVSQIKAKLVKYSADPGIESGGLVIEVRLKGEGGLNYHSEMSCQDLKGQFFCAVECDGGSVVVAQLDRASMTLKSNGFLIHGGCDGGEGDGSKARFLKAMAGGDDVFKLAALPASYCADSTAADDQSPNQSSN